MYIQKGRCAKSTLLLVMWNKADTPAGQVGWKVVRGLQCRVSKLLDYCCLKPLSTCKPVNFSTFHPKNPHFNPFSGFFRQFPGNTFYPIWAHPPPKLPALRGIMSLSATQRKAQGTAQRGFQPRLYWRLFRGFEGRFFEGYNCVTPRSYYYNTKKRRGSERIFFFTIHPYKVAHIISIRCILSYQQCTPLGWEYIHL